MAKLKNIQVPEAAHARVLETAEMLRTTRVEAAALLIEVADRALVIERHKELIDQAAADGDTPRSSSA